MANRTTRRQTGFTLVEIAIVLVIIGLLLGGVLKGQELINSAKSKNFINDFKSVPLLIYGYQDKFRALPGDDGNAGAHLGAAATLSPTNGTIGNGLIEGNYNASATTDETVAFWQHVRLANLAAGPTGFSPPGPDLPVNASGGRIGVQSAAPITGMSGSYFVCSDNIQGKFAKQIDITMDDGNTETGSVRTMVAGYAGIAQRALPTNGTADGTPYTVCMSF